MGWSEEFPEPVSWKLQKVIIVIIWCCFGPSAIVFALVDSVGVFFCVGKKPALFGMNVLKGGKKKWHI